MLYHVCMYFVCMFDVEHARMTQDPIAHFIMR